MRRLTLLVQVKEPQTAVLCATGMIGSSGADCQGGTRDRQIRASSTHDPDGVAAHHVNAQLRSQEALSAESSVWQEKGA
ncbi:hypothetical protein PAMP_001529 [Pampus punctatissimus]